MSRYWICLLAGVSLFASDQAGTMRDPSRMADLLAAPSPGRGTALFLAGPGGVFFYELPPSGTDEVRLSQFRLFSNDSPEPRALAYRDGSLIVADRRRSLLEIDLHSRQTSPLVRSYETAEPSGLDVAPDGSLAVADARRNAIVLLDRKGESRLLRLAALTEPRRVAIAGADLVIQDARGLHLASPNPGEKQAGRGPEYALKRMLASSDEIDAFTAYRGVVYVLTPGGLRALIGDSEVLLPSWYGRAGPRGTLATALDKDLYVWSPARQAVIRIARPAPVTFSVESEGEPARHAFGSIYSYLTPRGLLPLRPVSAERDYERAEDFLVRHAVFPGTSGGSPGQTVQKKARVQVDVAGAAFCGWNPEFCGPATGERALARPVPRGARLMAPTFQVDRSMQFRAIRLADTETVRDYLQRVSPDPGAMEIGFGYAGALAKLNASRFDPLESQLTRQSLTIMSPPQPGWRAGSLLLRQGTQLVPAGRLEQCRIEAPVSERALALPDLLRTHAVRDVLPLMPNRTGDGFDRSGVDEVVVRYENPVIETVTKPAEAFTACDAAAPARRLMVVRALKVSAARFRLLRNNSYVAASPEQLQEWGIAGNADPTKQWSLMLEGPLYVAFQAGELSPDGSFRPLDSSQARPGSTQDLLSRRGGSWQLPAPAWRMAAWVPAADLAATNSELLQLQKELDGLFVYPREEMRGLKGVAYTASGEASLETVRQQRQQLREAIHAPETEIDLSDQVIGVWEAQTIRAAAAPGGKQAELMPPDHPDFREPDGASLAWQKAEDGMLAPYPAPAAGLPPPTVRREFVIGTDHTLHVAGLLAGRARNGAPGLAPTARLLLITAVSVEAFAQAIDAAVDLGVKLFNVSTSLEKNDAISVLNKRMKTRWSECLFVAAAGNDGKNFSDFDPPAPVGWSDDIPQNIIGVAAADWDSRVLPSSNSGKKYVHLLAPGMGIYSTVADSGYAPASGSSVATPQVTAAAALLLGLNRSFQPYQLKARLIYTADFPPDLTFSKAVWGGALNIQRALLNPDWPVFSTENRPNEYRYVRLKGLYKLKISGGTGEVYTRRAEPLAVPSEIPWADVLRLHKDKGLFWIVYREQKTNMMRIISGAQIEDLKLSCQQMWAWKDQGFVETAETKAQCPGDLYVKTFADYVAPIPTKQLLF